jgi:hypothetical protein
MAEYLAALVIINETADTVKNVVDALQKVKNFVDSFKSHSSSNEDLKQYVDQMAQKIINEVNHAELNGHLDEISSTSDFWYTNLKPLMDGELCAHFPFSVVFASKKACGTVY